MKKRQNTTEKLMSVVKKLEKEEKEIEKKEDKIEKREEEILKKVDLELKKDKINRKAVRREVGHFEFRDFFKIAVGFCVFGLPAFISPDFWDYLLVMKLSFLIIAHIFFIFCIILSINYEFSEKFTLQVQFDKMLLKRFFYTYFSTMIVTILMLMMASQARYDMTNFAVLKNFLATQSVGIFGAVAFTFLERRKT